MSMFDSVKSFFSSHEVQDTPVVHDQETAWGSSLLYSGLEFPQYNPDDLINRKGFGIYKKMMIDEQVKSVVRFRRNATTGRQYFFTPPETDSLSDDEKKARTDLFEHILFDMSGVFKTRLDGIMDGMIFGFSLTEKVFHQIEFNGKTWYGIKSLKTKPAESFYPYTDKFGNVERLIQNVDGAEQELDLSNFIHYVQNPNVDEFYGQSEIREAYRAYFSKDIATRLHNMWLERMSGGFTWAQPMKGKTLVNGSTEYNSLVSVLNSIRNNTALILPSGIELNVEQPNDTKAFETAIAMHDKAIAKALLVPNLLGLSEQGNTGSFAQSQTQLEAFLWDLDAQSNYLEEVLNEQLFRHLGDINYGDGFYPKFTFKKLSFEQIKDVVNIWSTLTQSSVVKNTIDDENLIRNYLDIPQRQEEVADDGNVIEVTKQDTALNGAQVTSMLQVTTNVAEGLLAKEAAVQMLITAYPITLDRAKSIIDPIVVREVSEIQRGTGLGRIRTGHTTGRGMQNDKTTNEKEGVNSSSDPDTGSSGSIGDDNGNANAGDNGRGVFSDNKLNFSKHSALRRVDFASIGRDGTVIESTNTDLLADTMSKIVDELVAEFVTDFDFTNPDMKQISKIKVSSEKKRELKNTTSKMLKEGWKLGQLNADLELKKGLGDKRQLMSKLNFASIEDLAVKFFNSKSFQIAGDLSDKAVSIVRQEIMNGIQYTKTRDEVTQSIYERFVKQGYVAPGMIPEDALNELLKEVKPAHRIETIVRTNTFQAINEGRIATFEDPAIGDFVEAYEYSAILDGRTSAICNSLGDSDNPQIHAKDSPIWDTYKPANHFNCRSLLIAIIAGDVWTESAPPAVEPAEGFK